ncbi:MAG: aminoglycoside phosphotransferase family protein [Rhizomicrobium sp.]
MDLMGSDEEVPAALRAMGLLGDSEPCEIRVLPGGVSCDVYAVQTSSRKLCVKRALPKLRVEAEWRAPAERSESEVMWMRLVAGIDARWVPEILGEDPSRHIFAMSYFPPEEYPVWKMQLSQARGDTVFAARVGEAIARIHTTTAGRQDIAQTFANDAQFHALRIEPYLLYTAEKHPDVAERIKTIAQHVAQARIALMHGDMSPKNILCGPHTPVFLDAETCCYGDPAFDLAFCLNHLLLKCIWQPQNTEVYVACFAALKAAYFHNAHWETRSDLENRTAGLLAAILLARIDGKSPVEYIKLDRDKLFVRAMAKTFLRSEDITLGEMSARWARLVLARQ